MDISKPSDQVIPRISNLWGLHRRSRVSFHDLQSYRSTKHPYVIKSLCYFGSHLEYESLGLFIILETDPILSKGEINSA